MMMVVIMVVMIMILTVSLEESSQRWQQSYNDDVYDIENISGKCLSYAV